MHATAAIKVGSDFLYANDSSVNFGGYEENNNLIYVNTNPFILFYESIWNLIFLKNFFSKQSFFNYKEII